MGHRVGVLRLGRMPFSAALVVQKAIERRHLNELGGKIDSIGQDTLIVTEHDPVYTIGIRTAGYPDAEANRLKSLGAEFFRTNRGGLITFHGPGQLVVYPILNLNHFKKSIKWYVCQLEKTVIRTCEGFGVIANTSPHTGVWVGERKICAVGIHASRFITSHGLALNCCTDLDWFKHIVPCGIQGKGVTSLTEQTGRNVSLDAALMEFLAAFKSQFQCDLYEYSFEESCRLRTEAMQVS